MTDGTYRSTRVPQVRSLEAIERLLALLAFTHLDCTIGLGKPSPFGDGLRNVRKAVKVDYVRWIYECGQKKYLT